MRLQNEHIGDECKRCPVGDHASQADLRRRMIDAEAQRISDRLFDDLSRYAGGPLRIFRQKPENHFAVEARCISRNFVSSDSHGHGTVLVELAMGDELRQATIRPHR